MLEHRQLLGEVTRREMVGVDLAQLRPVGLARRRQACVVAPRMERAPGGIEDERRGLTGDAVEARVAAPVERAAATRAGPGRRDAGGCRRGRRRSPARPARPAYMTSTRSATPATTPRSWVIRMIELLVRSWMRSSTSSTCAWIVTSSAVVGSSAMSTSGSLAIDMAIIARWRMPPEYSCGYWSARSRGVRDPDQCRAARAPGPSRRRRGTSSWTLIASAIWLPTVYTGLSAVERVLEDHRDPTCPAPAAWPCRTGPTTRRPRSFTLPVTFAESGKQAEDRHRRDALARAGLADDPEGLVVEQVEAEVADRVDRTVVGRERHRQVTDLEHRARPSRGRGQLQLEVEIDGSVVHSVSACAGGRTRRAGRHPGSSRTAP